MQKIPNESYRCLNSLRAVVPDPGGSRGAMVAALFNTGIVALGRQEATEAGAAIQSGGADHALPTVPPLPPEVPSPGQAESQSWAVLRGSLGCCGEPHVLHLPSGSAEVGP